MKRSLGLLLGLLLPAVALASQPVELSMVVTGTITVNPDGTVRDYALDRQDKLLPAVIGLVKQTVSGWEFKPVMADGKPVLAQANMSLRVLARQTDDQHATVKVVGANFGCDASRSPEPSVCSPDEWVRPLSRHKPGYPMNLAMVGVGGIVYVVVQVNRDGHVANAAVRQVNLRARMRPHDSDVARKEFSQVSLAAAHEWTFRIPTRGSEAMKDHWAVVVPVVFSPSKSDEVQYGQWMAYIPGPMQTIPWAENHEKVASSGGTDAIPDGAVFQADPRFALLTPLGDAGVARPSPEANPGQG